MREFFFNIGGSLTHAGRNGDYPNIKKSEITMTIGVVENINTQVITQNALYQRRYIRQLKDSFYVSRSVDY